MPVRGKILNCLKADYDKIFKNDIITDLLKVLGCGVEVRGKAAKDLSAFDLENLRWHRIIICTDADVDGFPDPHADFDDALPADADADRKRIRLYCGVAAL